MCLAGEVPGRSRGLRTAIPKRHGNVTPHREAVTGLLGGPSVTLHEIWRLVIACSRGSLFSETSLKLEVGRRWSGGFLEVQPDQIQNRWRVCV